MTHPTSKNETVQTFEVWSVSTSGVEIATQRKGMGPTDMERYQPKVGDVFVRWSDYDQADKGFNSLKGAYDSLRESYGRKCRETERLEREIGTEKSGHLLTQGERDWAIQQYEKARAALQKLDNGYKYPTEVCQIAREGLSGESSQVETRKDERIQLSRLAGDIEYVLAGINPEHETHRRLTEVMQDLRKLAGSPVETSALPEPPPIHTLEGPIEVGQRFIWEPHNGRAWAYIEVTRVQSVRNDETRIWTKCLRGNHPKTEVWNDESRFREACVRAAAEKASEHAQGCQYRLTSELHFKDVSACTCGLNGKGNGT